MINRAINRFLLNMNMNPSLFVSFGGSIVQSTPYEQLKIDLVDGLWIVLHAYFVLFSRITISKEHLNKIELIFFWYIDSNQITIIFPAYNNRKYVLRIFFNYFKRPPSSIILFLCDLQSGLQNCISLSRGRKLPLLSNIYESNLTKT